MRGPHALVGRSEGIGKPLSASVRRDACHIPFEQLTLAVRRPGDHLSWCISRELTWAIDVMINKQVDIRVILLSELSEYEGGRSRIWGTTQGPSS